VARHPAAWAAAIAGVALALLAAAVGVGHMGPLDQLSVDNLMPFHDRPVREPSTWQQLMSPLGAVTNGRNSAAAQALFALTIPAAPLASAVVAVAALVVMASRGHGRVRIWAATLIGAAIAEVALKSIVGRPLLHQFDSRFQADVSRDAFNHSFPSGHTVRAALIVALLIELAPSLRFPLMLWLMAMSAALVLCSMHTPTDVLGGVLLALMALALMRLRPHRGARTRALPGSASLSADRPTQEAPGRPRSTWQASQSATESRSHTSLPRK
jgi:membrane-associated phospholipid phosphatase